MAGVVSNDRQLAARVRSKLLKKCEAILDGDDEELKKELLFKMCGTLLPRLNEVTGADGKDLVNVKDLFLAMHTNEQTGEGKNSDTDKPLEE